MAPSSIEVTALHDCRCSGIPNVLAFAYTIFNYAFLASFCRYKLPFIRDWMCSSWDQFERIEIEGFRADDAVYPALQPVLNDTNNFVSYELPFYLSRHETYIRAFRASLPGSTFSSSEEGILRTMLHGIHRSAPRSHSTCPGFMFTSLVLSNAPSLARSGIFSKFLMLILASTGR